MIWFILFTILVFILRTLFMIIGNRKEHSKNKFLYNQKSLHFISVVVPARNEEINIENCIRNIMKSNYPKDKFEIIAINDRSTDNTLSILQNLAVEFPNLKILNIKNDSEKNNLKGKPGALHQGILSSKGEIIMMTDADCQVNPNWISTIEQRFSNPEIGLVPSYTIINDKNIFDKLQALEWVYMHTMARAGVGNNNPLGCYGNNLSIRRTVYDKIGGYPNIKFSVTEDLALLKAVFKSGYRINYVCDYNSTVTTVPCHTFNEYILQHKRWAVGGIDLGKDAVYFVFTSTMIWLGLLTSILISNQYLFFAVIFTRILCDFFVLKPVLKILKKEKLLLWILPSIIFFMIMEIIIPPLLLDRKIIWKGQTFK